MVECWNAFCIATDCDGVSHVDVTGYSWKQERGTEYDPAVGEYVRPEDMQQPSPVFTMYERFSEEEMPERWKTDGSN
jgi:hypothetical protein